MNCKHQTAVRKAVQSGKWDRLTRSHFESCAICQEETRIAGWMKSFAEQTEPEVSPAEYGPIWLKAQFMEKQEAQRKALRPLVISQIVVEVLLGFVLLFLTFENLPLIQDWGVRLMADVQFDTSKVEPAAFPAVVSFKSVLFLMLFLDLAFLLTSNSFVREG